MSAERAIQGSETEAIELLEGTKMNNVNHDEGSLIYFSEQILFFNKKQTGKMTVLAVSET